MLRDTLTAYTCQAVYDTSPSLGLLPALPQSRRLWLPNGQFFWTWHSGYVHSSLHFQFPPPQLAWLTKGPINVGAVTN